MIKKGKQGAQTDYFFLGHQHHVFQRIQTAVSIKTLGFAMNTNMQ